MPTRIPDIGTPQAPAGYASWSWGADFANLDATGYFVRLPDWARWIEVSCFSDTRQAFARFEYTQGGLSPAVQWGVSATEQTLATRTWAQGEGPLLIPVGGRLLSWVIGTGAGAPGVGCYLSIGMYDAPPPLTANAVRALVATIAAAIRGDPPPSEDPC